ncbi:hypothetical protein P7C70_g5712, partial [Phenoliferia sp. Uapishka_3]
MSDPWCAKVSLPAPVWNGAELSPCFRLRVLNGIIPITFLFVTALACSVIVLRRFTSSQPIPASQKPSLGTVTRPKNFIAAAEELEIKSRVAEVVLDVVERRTRFHSTRTKHDVAALLGILGISSLEIVRFVGHLTEESAGVKWLAFEMSAWICALALSLLPFLPSDLGSFPSDFLLLPWVLLSVVTSFLDFWFSTFSYSTKNAFTLEASLFVLTTMTAFVMLTAPRPSSYTYSTTNRLPPPLELNKSLLSHITFSYVDPVVYRMAFPGRNAPSYSLATIPDLLPGEKSASQLGAYREGLAYLNEERKEKGKEEWSFVWGLLWYNRGPLAVGFAWSWVKVAVVALPPLGLKLLLQLLAKRSRGESAPTHVALLLAIGIAFFQMVKAVASARCLSASTQILMRTKALLISEIFAKGMRRRGGGGTSTADGASITNIIGGDVDAIASGFTQLNMIFPENALTIIVCMASLVSVIGIAAFAGVAALVLVIPIQTLSARMFRKYHTRMREAADARIAFVTDVIHGIRLVKYEAWEEQLGARMEKLRKAELAALWIKSLTSILDLLLMSGVPVVVAVSTFLCHTKVLHRDLDAASAFAALALFNIIQSPIDMFTGLLMNLITSFVSLRRVEAFLSEADTPKYDLLHHPESDSLAPRVGIRDASFSWSSVEGSFQLCDVTLDFPVGKLSVIVGRVGSGKSTLLSSLLGETTLLSGSVFLPSPVSRPLNGPAAVLTDSVAYCAQTPWLLSDTIEQNILFGTAKDEKRYNDVLEACALLPDLARLELGDATEVGEQGVVLSGGQKVKHALTRSLKGLLFSKGLYLISTSRAQTAANDCSTNQTVLLDDCLSAIDAHTAAHLVRECLSGPLLAGRTVILVTHAIDVALPICSFLVTLENGRVLSAGDPETVFQQTTREKIAPHLEAREFLEEKKESSDSPVAAARSKLVKEESQRQGSVPARLYIFYVKALGGWWLGLVALAFFTGAQLSEIGELAHILLYLFFAQNMAAAAALALKNWAQSYDLPAEAAGSDGVLAPMLSGGTSFWLKMYCLLSLVEICLFGGRTAFWLWRAVHAAKSVYEGLVKSLLGATVRFYDETPQGRILNRLSSDTGVIDQRLASFQMYMIFELFGVIGILSTITVVFPAFLIPATIITASYILIGYFCSVTKSPVFSIFGEVLNGVVTLRAYGDTMRFLRKAFGLLDTMTRPFNATVQTSRWLSIRCDTAGAVVSFAAAIVNMNALERVKEYTELEQETQGGVTPPAIWPSRDGSIEVENLSVRYTKDLPFALHDISFRIEAKGSSPHLLCLESSGKSTLALSFFRFIEASAGKITIDGIDIRTLSLAALRSRLIIVPQDSFLFSGPLRMSLDPFGAHADTDLWDAVRRVHLAAPAGVVEEGDGEHSWSAFSSGEPGLSSPGGFKGERQLVALARAILKIQSSSILILDESTASLDHTTDAKIQTTLREVMPDATVLCVAHRLRTIIDYSKVLVMGDGRILEYDAPWKLLEDPNSAFSELCRNSGEEELLRTMAISARDNQQ